MNKKLYIIEAGLEYLISILVTGSFLATLTKEIGMSDSITGILSSIISLGCVFQLLSVFIRKERVKPLVIILSVLNQLLFTALYIIPLSGLGSNAKVYLFIAVIFTAYLIYYVAHPKKTSWLMSQISDSERGRFTANKEIVSLILGMAFSFGMGAVVDKFVESGKIKTAFIIATAVMIAVTLLHTLSMILSTETEPTQKRSKSIVGGIRDLLHNKKIMSVLIVFVIYYIASYCAVPFYGTYQINELGFNLKTVTFLGILSSIARITVSKFWGRYADKNSFANMFEKCLIVLGLSYLSVVFATPKTGLVMFALYYILHGIAMGGANSALTNLVFDFAEPQSRADSLAVCQAASGVVGFLSTLAAGLLVSHIQANSNTLFGINIYAQQVTSLIAVLFVIVTILYARKTLHSKR